MDRKKWWMEIPKTKMSTPMYNNIYYGPPILCFSLHTNFDYVNTNEVERHSSRWKQALIRWSHVVANLNFRCRHSNICCCFECSEFEKVTSPLAALETSWNDVLLLRLNRQNSWKVLPLSCCFFFLANSCFKFLICVRKKEKKICPSIYMMSIKQKMIRNNDFIFINILTHWSRSIEATYPKRGRIRLNLEKSAKETNIS